MTEALIALVALTAMEIVLGIDNIVFIAILTGRLPAGQQPRARALGLGAAMCTRILLLVALKWILSLDEPLFRLSSLGISPSWLPWLSAEEARQVMGVSTRDLILLAGGLFLIGKSVHEIHEKLEEHEQTRKPGGTAGLLGVLVQIAVLDIIFSLDSVITAVGMANHLSIMILAIVLAVGVMLLFAGTVSAFIESHPTLKMLALSFLILIGVMLTAEAIGTPISKGYIYFAMAFSLVVEGLNIRVRRRSELGQPGS